jgi:hypothetical protein
LVSDKEQFTVWRIKALMELPYTVETILREWKEFLDGKLTLSEYQQLGDPTLSIPIDLESEDGKEEERP